MHETSIGPKQFGFILVVNQTNPTQQIAHRHQHHQIHILQCESWDFPVSQQRFRPGPGSNPESKVRDLLLVFSAEPGTQNKPTKATVT
jgi:hypothetical protein